MHRSPELQTPHRRPGPPDGGYSRQTVVVACAVILVALFTVTGVLSRAFHEKEWAIAEDWNQRGNAALAAGHAREARDSYRNALIYEPQNTDYQLHLAQALAAYGLPDQSRAYLLNLLVQFPGDGEINLDLARLAAKDGVVDAAVHYYHGAIYGAWDTTPVESRRNARLELATFLVNHREDAQAEAELITLAAGAPPDEAGLHATIGVLFSRAGDTPRALSEFEIALKGMPNNLDALSGAGAAAFRMRDYRRAADYLERALAERPGDAEIKSELDISRMVQSFDPFAPNLSPNERARRASASLAEAASRAGKCLSTSEEPSAGTQLGSLLDRVKAASPNAWSERGLGLHPEQIAPAMRAAFSLESEADQLCGKAQGKDLALELIRDLHADISQGAPGT